ncbi:MAG: secretin N-terminal domain-containing protein [Verrucomicrobiota bacterium]
MNHGKNPLLMTLATAGCLILAPAQDTANPTPAPAAPTPAVDTPKSAPAGTTAPTASATTTAAAPVAASAPSTPAPALSGNPDEILLNVKNAPLDLVLEHLSEAAGFVIVLETPAKGTVSVVSHRPVNRDEAVDLLNSILDKNGLAAIRDGRILTLVDRATAKARNTPVKVGNDPRTIPRNDEIVTQIIPLVYVEAEQLAKDLGAFISPNATFVANAAGNSIVMTDTQSNIRHLVEIIKAIDSSAEAGTEIRVFHLKHANPNDVATALSGVFPSSSGSGSGNGNNQAPIRFGGGGFGGFGGFGGGGGGFGGGGTGGGGGGRSGGGSAQSDRIRKASQVLAVADLRTSSVVVTASKDLMGQIGDVIKELDVPTLRDQQVYVFRMTNADPQQAVQVLQNMFQSQTANRTGMQNQQNSALMQRQLNNNNTMGSSSSANGSGFGGGNNTGGTGGRLF